MVPRGRQKILQLMKFGASDSVIKISKPRHRNQNLRLGLHHGREFKGFKLFPAGDVSDTDDEEDYPVLNVRATYVKANFARIGSKFGVQDDVINDYVHKINIMAYPDEIVRTARRLERLCHIAT
jgi:hypothetical protein